MRVTSLCRGLGLGLGLVAGACNSNGPGSQSTGGTDTDACTPGALNCVCEANGCDSGLVCSGGFCVEGSDSSGTTIISGSTGNNTTVGTTGTGPDPTESSGGSGTTMAQECTDPPGPSAQCSGGTPYCSAEGTCVGCTGVASCADIDAGTPACDAGSGLCVECTADDASACDGGTPVCDAASNACVKCDAHAQCSSGACELDTGACFPDSAVLWVDKAAACDGDGSESAPFCEIQDAVETIAAGTPTVVRVAAGMAYKVKIDVNSNAVVAIVGDGGPAVIDVDQDALLINDDARVFLGNLRFVGSAMMAGRAIRCLNADVWIDEVEVSSRETVAIDALGCGLEMRRARVYSNPGGGLKLDGGTAYVENLFLTSNGTNFSPYGGIYVANMGELTAVYATIIDNDSGAFADSLHCADPGPVVLRNAMLFGQSEPTSVSCDGAEASDSVVDSNLLGGGDNVMTQPALNPAWFKDAFGGDFHFKADAPFAAAGTWRAGDPAVDYDGEARPDVDLSSDWVGADRLP